MPRPLFVAGIFALMFCGWIGALPAVSEAKCPPWLEHPSREIECKLNEQIVDCGQPMTPGTKAAVTCNEFYTREEALADDVTTCMPDGTWSHPGNYCFPRCGETYLSMENIPGYNYWWYLTNKNLSDAVKFPWTAGIYREVNGKYVLICGGTVISERAIISAAHCFWDGVTNKPNDQKLYKIAVGKSYTDWDKDEPNAQLPEIDKVILSECYRGPKINYGCDISLVKLKKPLQMTYQVRPICVDFNRMYDVFLAPGKLGVVVGWGGNVNETYSEKPRPLTLPYVDFETCEKAVPSSFVAYFTSDKFCAGYLNGTSLCPGDGGHGYAVQVEDGKWYLMGVVNVGVPLSQNNYACNQFSYTLYTRVSSYYDFIRSSLSRI